MSGSKHARGSRLRRTPAQNARYAAVNQDSALLQDLILRLWAALPPGSTPAGGEKLGKVGKRSASPAGVNVAVHDLLVLIVNGVLDLVMRARDQLGDRPAAAVPVTFGDTYMRQWSAAQRPRSNEDYRQAYEQLKFLPGLVDRLHGRDDGEALARRIEHDLARWIRDGRTAAGANRPRISLGDCPLVYNEIRPCGDWDGRRWHPGTLRAYLDADRSKTVGTSKDADVWCSGCGTRWTHTEYADLVVTLADKETG